MAATELTPLDLRPVQEGLAAFDQALEEMGAQARSLVVADQHTLEEAVELAATAKRLYQAIEKRRREWLEAPQAFIRAVNHRAKRYQERLQQVEAELKYKISDYQARLEAERRRLELQWQEEARELQAALQAASEEPQPLVVAPVLAEPSRVVRTQEGAASQRTVWTFEVVDPALVPREYLTVDEQAIRAAIKAGVRRIPGVRIFEKRVTVIRT